MKLFRVRIKFLRPHRSIAEFNPIESNTNFMILTGKNGSGKTQLLEALDNGSVQVDSIKPTETIYFNYIDFKIENEREYSQQALAQELREEWNLFTKNRNPTVQQSLKSIRQKAFNPEEEESLKKIAEEHTKPLLKLGKQDINSNELYEKFCSYKSKITDYFSRDPMQGQQFNTMQQLLKKTNGFVDGITQEEFNRMYIPINLKKSFLPSNMGKIFLRYRIKEYEEFLEKVDHAGSEPVNKLREESAANFLMKNGKITPWDYINSILKAYSGFDYILSFPDRFAFDQYAHQGRSFLPKLANEQKNVEIDYQSLSSGEHTLFALALCLFKTNSDNLFPKLLLLDEVDSSLHPSMIENLFRVIKDVFLQNGTKVMLTTHSPTTIALAEEESIFVVNKEGKARIEKSSKNNALKILTESLATVDKGLKLFDQISRKKLSIITEGNNIEYIRRAIELFSVENEPKIDLLTAFQHRSSKSQLKTLFDFFTLAKPDKKVLFVWDSDFTSKFEEKNNTYGFVFEKNPSRLKNTGIESLFADEHLDKFVSKTTDSDGKLVSVHITGDKKQEFKRFILSDGDSEAFNKFRPLIQKINEMLTEDQISKSASMI